MSSSSIGSYIHVISKEEEDKIFRDAVKEEVMRYGHKHICMDKINKDYLEKSLDTCDYLFVHMFGDEIRGFACVYEEDTTSNYLYIGLICNAQFHKMVTRETRKTRKYGGKNILDAIKETGLELGVDSIRLSALEHVVTYYKSLGYQLTGEEKDENGIPMILYLPKKGGRRTQKHTRKQSKQKQKRKTHRSKRSIKRRRKSRKN